MKQTTRWLLLAACVFSAMLSLVSQPAFPQCEVSSKRNVSGGIAIQTALEDVYKKGYRSIRLMMEATVNGESVEYWLCAITTEARGEKLPVPRKLRLSFEKTFPVLEAETMKTQIIPEILAEQVAYWYRLNDRVVNSIQQEDCSEIELFDTRTGRSLSIGIPADLLGAQLKCIQKEVAGIVHH